jgi:c-di-GMP-related signal transduction protein
MSNGHAAQRRALGLLPHQRRAELVRTRSELQAIRNDAGATIGYELFYRDSEAAENAVERTTAATLNVLAGLTGVNALVGADGRERSANAYLYFVNVTRDFLVGVVDLPDPSEVAVLEVQPDTYADEAVRQGAVALRSRGYGVALDRYVPGQPNAHDLLLPLASHIKLDIDGGDEATLRHTVGMVREKSDALLIGCRIGSRIGLDLARDLGCNLFQGYALDDSGRQRQQVIRGSLTTYMRLLQLLATDDNAVDIAQVTNAVKSDPDLALRVLRACNTAAAGSSRTISSVQQAVVLLGIGQLRRRVHLAVAQGLAVEGEEQLLAMIEYATLADLVGIELGVPPGTGFLAGLLLETADVLQTSIDQMLDGLPLEPRLAAELRHRTGSIGRILGVIEAYKQGSDNDVAAVIVDIASLHVQAMLAAADLTHQASDGATPATKHTALPPMRLPSGTTIGVGPTSSGGSGEAAAAPPGGSTEPIDTLTEILGPAPTADETARADRWHTWARERSWQRFCDGSVAVADLAPMIGIEQQQLAKLVDRGAVACHDVDGVLYLPVWQFTEDGRLVDGVEDLVNTFPGDAVALSEWVTQPCQGLQRRIPLALMLQDQAGDVLVHAKALAAW